MRWPWQRREEEAAHQPALPARRDDAARVSPMGWAFLPPLQRQLGDMPLVARTASFPAQLPAWQNPSFTGTLAHRVSTDAPSGVIDGDGGGTGEPTVHSSSPDLTLLAPAPVRPPPVQRAVASTSASSSSDRGPTPVHAPLTTATPAGLPVLAVQSYDVPAAEPTGVPSEIATDSSEGVLPPEATPATGESSPPGADAAPSTPTGQTPAVQRSTDAAAPLTLPTVRSRPSVGGRRLGLGAPLPALPLASDVPPVQRSVDVPPALGSEGAEGYVEVDIPSRPNRSEQPADAVAEADAPTLGPATAGREMGLDAASTPETATPAPPPMPVAPIQRSLVDTSDTTAPEPVESIVDDVSDPGATSSTSPPAEPRTEPNSVHHVPASGTGDRRTEVDGSTPTAGAVQDRPVLAQRSMANPADTTPASSLQTGPSRTPASDLATPARELRHTGSHPAAPAEGPQLQRTAVGPTTGGAAGATVQRSIEAPSARASHAEATATDSFVVDDHGPADEAPAPDQPEHADAASVGGTSSWAAHSAMPPIAPTRPMLSTAAPLTSLATASVQRAEDTTEVRSSSDSHWSPPVLTRTPGHAPTAATKTPQLRSTSQRTQLAGVQRVAVGGHLQRSVGPANGSPTTSTTSAPSSPTSASQTATSTSTSTLPLAAQSTGDEPAVQTSLAEDPAEDATAVPVEAATVPETRGVAGSTSTTPSPGGDATAGASSPEQLEALAGRLFAPLMRRIRSEMLLDRERRGLRTDSW